MSKTIKTNMPSDPMKKEQEKKAVQLAIGDFTGLLAPQAVTHKKIIPTAQADRSSRRPPLRAFGATNSDRFKELLLSRLQTSLDVEQLLHHFHDTLSEHLAIETLDYQLERDALMIQFGQSETAQSNTRLTYIGYSLIASGEQAGIIRFGRQEKFNQEEVALISEAVSTLSYPMRNALRYREALKFALTDSLTQVGNRLAFDNTLNKEVEKARRYGIETSVLMIDIDNFKTINDRLGHYAGDKVLKSVAQVLSGTCRQADAAYRYGGEEFTVVLSSTGLAGAKIIGERIRAGIEDISIDIDGEATAVTVSIGAACYSVKDNPKSLLKRADKALYLAKAAGKNLVKSLGQNG